MPAIALSILMVFLPLSLVTIGGGQSAVADMHRQIVDVHQWMTASQFVDAFAISRLAPGPGSLLATLIGWRIGGAWGAGGDDRHLRADRPADLRRRPYLVTLRGRTAAEGAGKRPAPGRGRDDPRRELCADQFARQRLGRPRAGAGLDGAADGDAGQSASADRWRRGIFVLLHMAALV